MSNLLAVSLTDYREVQWAGLVEDMRGLIADGMHTLPNFVQHHATKRGLTYEEAQVALIQAEETR